MLAAPFWPPANAGLSPSPQASALKVSTPLTGRKYVQNAVSASPLSSAMKSVGRLHTLLSGTQQEPSAKLKEVLRYVCGAVEQSGGSLPVPEPCHFLLTHFRTDSKESCCYPK